MFTTAALNNNVGPQEHVKQYEVVEGLGPEPELTHCDGPKKESTRDLRDTTCTETTEGSKDNDWSIR